MTVTEIKRLMAQERVFTTVQTIKKTITRWEATRPVQDRPQTVWRATISQNYYRLMDETMAENDECTASEVKMLLAAMFGAENMIYSEQ